MVAPCHRTFGTVCRGIAARGHGCNSQVKWLLVWGARSALEDPSLWRDGAGNPETS